MKTEIFFNLNGARPLVTKRFTKNPRASVSAMFRALRKDTNFRYFGDFPIMSVIVESLNSLGIEVSRSALQFASRQSKELSGQSILYDELLKHA